MLKDTFAHAAAGQAPGSCIFVAGYSGLFHSCNDGLEWAKLDVQLPLITSLHLGSNTGNTGLLDVGACTYGNGCFRGVLDVEALRLGQGECAMKSWGRGWQPPGSAGRYNILKFAPGGEGTILLSAGPGKKGEDSGAMCHPGAACFTLSEDGGRSFEAIKVPTIDAHVKSKSGRSDMVHSIEFSPNFASDRTAFISGFNIGVARSTDGGHSFQRIWNPFTHETMHDSACVKIALSPSFGQDHIIIAAVLDHNGDGAYDRAQGSGATVHVSRDGGSTWVQVADAQHPADSTGRWQGDVRVLYSTAGQPALVGVENGRLLLNKDFTRSGWCKLVLEGDYEVMRNGLGTTRDTVLVAVGDRTLAGKVDADHCRLVEMIESAPPAPLPPGSGLPHVVGIGQQSVPADDQLRGIGSLVAISPLFDTDGVILGGSGFDVLGSADRGQTWQRVVKLGQVLYGSQCRDSPSGCELCRSWGTHQQAFSKGQVDARSDDGLYCIECDECHTRNAMDGSCQRKPGDCITRYRHQPPHMATSATVDVELRCEVTLPQPWPAMPQAQLSPPPPPIAMQPESHTLAHLTSCKPPGNRVWAFVAHHKSGVSLSISVLGIVLAQGAESVTICDSRRAHSKLQPTVADFEACVRHVVAHADRPALIFQQMTGGRSAQEVKSLHNKIGARLRLIHTVRDPVDRTISEYMYDRDVSNEASALKTDASYQLQCSVESWWPAGMSFQAALQRASLHTGILAVIDKMQRETDAMACTFAALKANPELGENIDFVGGGLEDFEGLWTRVFGYPLGPGADADDVRMCVDAVSFLDYTAASEAPKLVTNDAAHQTEIADLKTFLQSNLCFQRAMGPARQAMGYKTKGDTTTTDSPRPSPPPVPLPSPCSAGKPAASPAALYIPELHTLHPAAPSAVPPPPPPPPPAVPALVTSVGFAVIILAIVTMLCFRCSRHKQHRSETPDQSSSMEYGVEQVEMSAARKPPKMETKDLGKSLRKKMKTSANKFSRLGSEEKEEEDGGGEGSPVEETQSRKPLLSAKFL